MSVAIDLPANCWVCGVDTEQFVLTSPLYYILPVR